MPTIEKVDHTPHSGLIDKTVADVHRRWAEYVDREDLVQEALCWWYGPGQPYLPAYLSDDANHVRLRRSIWRWCARFAEREKAARSGYQPEDVYRYSARAVARLIPYCLDPDGLPSGPGAAVGGPKPKGNLAESGDLLATWLDVRRALDQLAEDDLHYLHLVADLEQDWERVGAHTGVLPDSCRRRHARIAERMARWLNDPKEKK